MLDQLEFYFWGLLISLNWMIAWDYTTLKVKFLKIWLFLRGKKEELYTPMDFDNYVGFHWGILGELLTCSICFSHWVSGFTAFILCFYFKLEYHMILIAFFTYPAFIYTFNKKIIN